MDGRHVTVLGDTGAGKTSMARMLAQGAPRVIVIDPEPDQTWTGLGGEFSSVADAVDLLTRHPADSWQMLVRTDNREADLLLLDAVMQVQETDPDLPPLLVVIEESGLYSDTHHMPEELEHVVKRGRKRGVILLSIAQEKPDMNPSVRRQSFLSVALRTTDPPAGVREQFPAPEQLAELQTVTPFTDPVQGMHYRTHPEGVDPFEHLRAGLQGTRPDPLPEDYEPPRTL